MKNLVKSSSNSAVAWRVDSCGTSNEHEGDTPDERTLQVCRARLGDKGLPMPLHRGRQLRAQDLAEFDYIFCMDEWNLKGVETCRKRAQASSVVPKAKVALLTAEDPERTHEVADPYYGGLSGFESIFVQIDRCIRHFMKRVDTSTNL